MITLFLIYLFLIKPNKRRDVSALLGFEYAHRGYFDVQGGIKENTLEAFQAAVDKGLGMEFDVQLTRDEQVVVCHDASLKRVYGIDKVVGNEVYADIAFVPTLEQVLKLVNGQTPLIVEVKSYDRQTRLCEKTRDILVQYQGAYCVESFDPRIVRWFKVNAPQMIRGQLSEGGRVQGAAMRANKYLLGNVAARPDFIAYKVGTEKNVTMYLMKHLFKPLMVTWTVRNQAQNAIAQRFYDLQIFERQRENIDK